MSSDDLWKQMSDEDVLAASLHLDDYTEGAQATITAELARRGLTRPPPEVAEDPILVPSSGAEFENRFLLTRLWLGGYPLPVAFWGWLLLGQIVWMAIFAVSVSSPLLFFAFAMANLVYTGIALVGVWRSAKRYKGPPRWATLAQAFVLIAVVGFIADLLKGMFAAH